MKISYCPMSPQVYRAIALFFSSYFFHLIHRTWEAYFCRFLCMYTRSPNETPPGKGRETKH